MFTLYTSNVRFLARAFGDGPGQSRTETVQRSYGNRAAIVQSPQPTLGNRTGPVRRGTVTVRLSCSLGIPVPKVYNFTFLLVLSVKMALKTKGGKGKRSKKVNVYLSQGGRTVMMRSPWDCRKITALYPFDFMGIARAPCDNIAMGAARLSQILQSSYDVCLVQMTI